MLSAALKVNRPRPSLTRCCRSAWSTAPSPAPRKVRPACATARPDRRGDVRAHRVGVVEVNVGEKHRTSYGVSRRRAGSSSEFCVGSPWTLDVITGVSLVPVMVMVTVCVEMAPLSSVTVTS